MIWNNNLPLVSIVTPSYNQGRFIEETIQSVLSQSYPNIEYIVMDGGSTDNTIEILKKYEGKLKWVSEKDKGQSDAINKGFRMAMGEILAWLNSDDTYLPGAVKKVVDFFNAHPDVSMVYGKGYSIDKNGEIISQYPTELFNYERLAEIDFICQPAAFFKADIFDYIEKLDTDLHYVMDYDLWIRIAQNFKVEYIPDFLASYRIHIDAKTSSRPVATYEEALKTVKKYYGKVGGSLIYGYSYNLVKSREGSIIIGNKFLTGLRVILHFLLVYLRINKSLPLKELRTIDKNRIKKLIGEL